MPRWPRPARRVGRSGRCGSRPRCVSIDRSGTRRRSVPRPRQGTCSYGCPLTTSTGQVTCRAASQSTSRRCRIRSTTSSGDVLESSNGRLKHQWCRFRCPWECDGIVHERSAQSLSGPPRIEGHRPLDDLVDGCELHQAAQELVEPATPPGRPPSGPVSTTTSALVSDRRARVIKRDQPAQGHTDEGVPLGARRSRTRTRSAACADSW